jgi:hypothetical protein
VKPRLAWLWWLLAVPGALQLVLLAVAFGSRLFYPFDLEWMEGGMLTHALRFTEGRPVYAPPSAEFIPYLYTPLYPALLAGLGQLVGLGYPLGRAVSIVSIAVVMFTIFRAVVREAPADRRGLARVAGVSALGLLAATYPWVECFFDLVRGDSLFLALGVGGLAALRIAAARPTRRGRGFLHVGVAVAGAILAVSFFAKQTGVLLVLAGGAALLPMNWRALPVYVGVTGVIGLGGTAVGQWLTGGWWWVYVYQVHQNHDTNADRFWRSFGLIFGHFPVATALVALGLIAVVAHAIWRRRLPVGGAGFLYWTWMYACAVLIGAVGWSTQWAVFNAYIPAMALGALAAGLALVPIVELAAELAGVVRAERIGAWAGGAVLALLALQLWVARWDPRWSATVGDGDTKAVTPGIWQIRASVRPFVPQRKDREAGQRLLAELRAIDGEIFFPSHPWYPRLAGKQATFAHRIGVKDVTYQLPCTGSTSLRVGNVQLRTPCGRKGPVLPPEARVIAGLAEAGRTQRFAAVVLDDGEQIGEYPGLAGAYRDAQRLPGDHKPRVFSGKPTTPGQILRPAARPRD